MVMDRRIPLPEETTAAADPTSHDHGARAVLKAGPVSL
jgi:hypothetical protein